VRSHSALYVDVGYLLASAATRVTGTSLRSGVNVDYGRLIDALIAQVEDHSGLPVLRVNWYDSGGRPGGQADATQERIGMLPRVKLRLGRLSYAGEQKGVDVRLGLDLATHGRNRVVDIVYLVSGDDDLTEAVEEAQGHGAQVVVLAVPDRAGSAYGSAGTFSGKPTTSCSSMGRRSTRRCTSPCRSPRSAHRLSISTASRTALLRRSSRLRWR
jgi:hypothetical protein